MDTRLIFRDFCNVRWGDGGQYVERIIGFTFGPSGSTLGKSGVHYSKRSENAVVSTVNLTKRASKKSL